MTLDRGAPGVIVYDIEEVMKLAAGTFEATIRADTSANMDLVLEICDSLRPHALLEEIHQDLIDGRPAGTAPLSGLLTGVGRH